MNVQISANCQAILLLTAPLMVGKAGAPADLLKQKEYNELTKFLVEEGYQPADLLNSQSPALRQAERLFVHGRLAQLVGRGFQLAQALDYWSARSIWVVSRADARYPKRIKSRLKHDAPPIMYGCGNPALVDNGGLAVVGSRNADDEILSYAQHAGETAASAGRGVISGGARGVDSAAMDGAAALGGIVCNVMAEGLAAAAISRRFREGIFDQRTLLISPYDPSAGFNIGHAIARNKFIFALADIGLVVNSDLVKGGTWSGAIEQLRKLHYVPLFVRSSGKHSAGLKALLDEGALPWPNPVDGEELNALFEEQLPENHRTDGSAPPGNLAIGKAVGARSDAPFVGLIGAQQASLLEESANAQGLPKESSADAAFTTTNSSIVAPSPTALNESRQEMFATFERLIKQVLQAPKKVAEIADELDLNQTQTREWLERLVAKGIVEKEKGKTTYRLAA
ncbi:DNA-processing protein DprA [Undibacterium sp.]|uniref:DNA-processing protein DprA n=1 Tax=Undibacterium sp. TaxID=1914977 RepID=UPI0025E54521|nr:DNA-processing protein DprA [Undibacterium sp.]